MSVWTTAKSFPRRRNNSSFQNGAITIDFDRTKYNRIFTHINGKVEWEAKDVNSARQATIDSSSLFSVVSVYSEDRLLTSNTDKSYTLLAHGVPSQKDGKENCVAARMSCSSGQGTDKECNPGKCISGRISRVSETRADGTIRLSPYKWQFVSDLETYYALQKDGVIDIRHNRLGTSRACKFYVPPNSYLEEETFVRELFKNFAYLILVGGEDKKERFIAEGIKKSSYYNNSPVTVEDLLIEDISSLNDPWYSLALSQIDQSRYDNPYDQDFLADVYDRLSNLFNKGIQTTRSSLTQASFDYGKEDIARPIYYRLPGVAGAYSSIDNEETPSKWLVSGADEQLSESKGRISNFYRDYLDPDTCYPSSLDWLAQHIGMFGNLWDVNWPIDIKRTLIKNMFGWWDREVDGVNHKSKILNETPFITSSLWTSDSEDIDSQGNIDYGEIEKFTINSSNNGIELVYKYVTKDTDTDEDGVTSLVISGTDDPKFLSEDWNGLIESKGGLLSIIFLVSVFGLKSHTPLELEVVDLERGLLRPRSGLRSLEVSSSPLLPFKTEPAQVGDSEDLRVNNYKNQLVVGYTKIYDPEDTKNIIFRVPFYYNRNGKSWSKVEYIAKNWAPANTNPIIQYPYLCADLWRVGDAFFEPDYEVE